MSPSEFLTGSLLLQFQNAYGTLYFERQLREYDLAARGTNRDSPQGNKENPEEEHVAEVEEENLDFCDFVSRGAKRKREEEERMTEYLKKMNDSLGEIANGCEKAGQSLGRLEEAITGFVPRVERMFWQSATGCGGGKIPLASVKKPRAEQKDSPKHLWYEEVVGTGSPRNPVGGSGREGALNKGSLSAAELYRTVRESAPSPEPRRGYWLFQPGL